MDDSSDSIMSSSGQIKNWWNLFWLKKHHLSSKLEDYLPKVLSLAFGVWTFWAVFCVAALLLCRRPFLPVHMPGPLDKISHLQVAIQHRWSWFFTFQIFFQNHFRILTPLIEGLMSWVHKVPRLVVEPTHQKKYATVKIGIISPILGL